LLAVLLLLGAVFGVYIWEVRYWNMSDDERAELLLEHDIGDRFELYNGVKPDGGFDADYRYRGAVIPLGNYINWVGVDNSTRELSAFQVTADSRGEKEIRSDFDPESFDEVYGLVSNSTGEEILNDVLTRSGCVGCRLRLPELCSAVLGLRPRRLPW